MERTTGVDPVAEREFEAERRGLAAFRDPLGVIPWLEPEAQSDPLARLVWRLSRDIRFRSIEVDHEIRPQKKLPSRGKSRLYFTRHISAST